MAERRGSAMPVVADQPSVMAEAAKKVKEQGFYMKRCFDQSDLRGALTHASDMLRQLRTSLLTPRNYYELYMKVLDELRHLDDFFNTLVQNGTPASELYEKAQACGDVLPRLYLLVTAGAVYIKTLQAPAKDILNDLVEMAKGVQHPMRGLFLRNYLAQACRDKLPDAGSPFEGTGGDVSHAVDFVLQNFSEANRLWVRMQNQGAKHERKKREKERKELRILVGTNLVRLSQLDGVDVDRYVESVLPRLLEQVVNCKDTIAQPYLLDCIIQVFPDEFHLATLESFLATCTQLRDKVNVREILEAMMRRLAAGARDGEEGALNVPPKAFAAFNGCVAKLVEGKKGAIEVAELLKLQGALLEFAIECYPGRLDYVNHCLGTVAAVLRAAAEEGAEPEPLPDEDAEHLERCLELALNQKSLGLTGLLQLDLLEPLLAYLPYARRRDVATRAAEAVLRAGEPLESIEAVESLFGLLGPLLKDEPGAAPPAEEEGKPEVDARVEREQQLVARLAHLAEHDDTDVLFKVLGTMRKHFGQGGLARIKYTLVPLVFRALALSRVIQALEKQPDAPKLQFSCRKVFQFVHEIVTAMAGHFPELSLHLFLEAAVGADAAGLSAIAYAFVSEAFILYEDELPDSKAQIKAIHAMIGALVAAKGFSDDDYDALVTKTTLYSAKLFKKPDQCRMVANCSHLFWAPEEPALPAPPDEDDATAATAPPTPPPKGQRDAKRVLECLQKSLKIADACMTMTTNASPIHLFVEILDHYVAHFEAKNPMVTTKYISGLVALINEHIDNMENVETRAAVERHYKNTKDRIRSKNIIPLD